MCSSESATALYVSGVFPEAPKRWPECHIKVNPCKFIVTSSSSSLAPPTLDSRRAEATAVFPFQPGALAANHPSKFVCRQRWWVKNKCESSGSLTFYRNEGAASSNFKASRNFFWDNFPSIPRGKGWRVFVRTGRKKWRTELAAFYKTWLPRHASRFQTRFRRYVSHSAAVPWATNALLTRCELRFDDGNAITAHKSPHSREMVYFYTRAQDPDDKAFLGNFIPVPIYIPRRTFGFVKANVTYARDVSTSRWAIASRKEILGKQGYYFAMSSRWDGIRSHWSRRSKKSLEQIFPMRCVNISSALSCQLR